MQALRDEHGYNEFDVAAPEPLLLKFAKTIYESPLILLLLGSAVVSALMGNVDDAVSIGLAILIVLTGECHMSAWPLQLCRQQLYSRCSQPVTLKVSLDGVKEPRCKQVVSLVDCASFRPGVCSQPASLALSPCLFTCSNLLG